MTTPTLECIEFTVEDPGVPCDSALGCPNPAIYAVRLFCGCIRLSCQKCLDYVVNDIREDPGVTWGCWLCRTDTPGPVMIVSDFIKSITPL